MATATYKCPNCGGGLKFDPDVQKSTCEYCLSEFTNQELADISAAIEQKAAAAHQAEQASQARQEQTARQAAEDGTAGTEQGDDPLAHMVGYVCDSCGAEVVTEDTTSATFCYYCHNPVLVTSRLSGVFRPDKIIPFQYDREKAIQKFLAWARTKKFVPPSFYSTSQLEKITGLYLPYWMADYQADVDYAGVGTNRRVWVSGNMEHTEYKDYRIERQGTIEVDNIHELAMKKIDKELIDSITPFDEKQAIDFNMSYLNGFFAEKYDISKDEVRPVIENRTRNYAAMLLQESIGAYSQVKEERNSLNLSLKSWQYTLFPTWILTYQYLGKTFIYAINGQNGKANGELPVDKKKLGLTAALIAAGILALTILGGWLLW